MKLNDLEVSGHFSEDGRLCFELACDWESAAKLNGQKLTVTDGEKKVSEYYGYKLVTIDESSSGTLYCWFALNLSDATESAINQIKEALDTVRSDVASALAVNEATKAAARLSVASMDFSEVSSTDVVSVISFVKEWEPGISLGENDPVSYKGKLYRTSQAIAETQEQYPPDTAGESLYYPIEVADDGIIVFRISHGKYDSVRKGEMRHYPDASGPVYVSLIDFNTTIPGSDPRWWEMVDDE